MRVLRVRGVRIPYDESKKYMTAYTMSVGHAGIITAHVHEIFPTDVLMDEGVRRKDNRLEFLLHRLQTDTAVIRGALRKGRLKGGDKTIKISKDQRPMLENTLEYYGRVVDALKPVMQDRIQKGYTLQGYLKDDLTPLWGPALREEAQTTP
ncbi:MAG: hypothetical protein IIA87_05510 [Nanoarchaeota archaeon]|nr:hypothetical protein [Nanoarchaeota archaeon]